MKRFVLFFSSLFLLSGCANLSLSSIDQATNEAADVGLEVSEVYLCETARIGAVRKRFGVSEEIAEAYRKLCERNTNGSVLK